MQQEVFDLHLETSIPARLYGYDINRDHGASRWFGYLYEHVDLPRAKAGGLTGAMWSLATNLAQPRFRRFRTLCYNADWLRNTLEAKGQAKVVTTASEYQRARADGKHAALICVQGGNAWDGLPDNQLTLDPNELITRVTLVHMTNSTLGQTSSPLKRLWLGPQTPLTQRGKVFVEMLNHNRAFVDVSHISDAGFDAVWDVHDKKQPLLATHSSSRAQFDHWRALTQDQVRKIADTGGVVGVIFCRDYLLADPKSATIETVADHVDALVREGGEDCVAIGSDLDGDIVPPVGLRNARHAYLNLAYALHRRGYSEAKLQKFLAGNFLRAFAELRP